MVCCKNRLATAASPHIAVVNLHCVSTVKLKLFTRTSLPAYFQVEWATEHFAWDLEPGDKAAGTLVFPKVSTNTEKAVATHSGILAWRIPWTQEPGRLQAIGSQRVENDWATSLSLFTFMHWRRKWQPTPVFLPEESQGWQSCRLWGRTESDTTEVTQQQQHKYMCCRNSHTITCLAACGPVLGLHLLKSLFQLPWPLGQGLVNSIWKAFTSADRPSLSGTWRWRETGFYHISWDSSSCDFPTSCPYFPSDSSGPDTEAKASNNWFTGVQNTIRSNLDNRSLRIRISSSGSASLIESRLMLPWLVTTAIT